MNERRRASGRIFPRFSVREDVEREIAAHLALRVEELVAQGWTVEEAEAEARRLLGDRGRISRACVEIVRSHHRAERRARIVDAVIQDLRYGVRTVLGSPGFAIVAIVTLALGIGANTAIFSVIDGVLLEPLPFPEPEELVAVWETRPQGGVMQVAWANFEDWKRESSSFAGLFAYGAGSSTVLGGVAPTTARVAVVTHDLWSALDVLPVEGRLTTPDDHVYQTEPTVLVRHDFWRNELGGRVPDELLLDVNGLRARVVGVIPTDFDFPSGAQLWMPLELLGQSTSRTAHNWRVVGRLADGVPLEQAATEMDGLTRRLVLDSADQDPRFLATGATLRPLREQIVGTSREPLLLLLGAAGLVLLIACTNMASTLLARGNNRARELAVRASLGAGQPRIVRQLLTESALLATVGALAGVGLGATVVGVLKRVGPQSIPRLEEVGVDGSVLLFTAAIAVLTTFLFGLFPAWRITRGATVDALRSGSRGSSEGRRGVVWKLLVGTEVGLALVLLVAAGLLIRSFQTLLAVDTGVDASDVISTPVALSRVKYPSPEQHAAWHRQTLADLEATPGVAAAGVMTTGPASGGPAGGRLELDGDLEKSTIADYVVASGGVFEALDIPLLQGRMFDDLDGPDAPHVAIVSESFAREVWPDESPIGHTVTGGGMDNFYEERTFAEVVGVVGDARYYSLARPPEPTVYFPYTQRPFRAQFGAILFVEAANGDPGSVAQAFRAVIERNDPDIPIALSTQESLIGQSLAPRQFPMLLMLGFAGIALALAVVGIYGVVSYSVARRTREMGIRLALGADPAAVLRMVMVSSLAMVWWGLALGFIVTFSAARLMEGLIYGVTPADPFTIIAATLILAAAAVAASWLPARVGTRVDPIVTMRAE